MSWFGNLDLAYKYVVVFLSLLVFTVIAGVGKVLYNRHKLKKHTEAQKVEEGRRDDLVELNQREKDEGDLFGIRAIEAGYFGGVSQSRPTSRAPSRAGSFVESPSMSSNTLVGSPSPNAKVMNLSMNNSVASLPPAHTNGRNSPPGRKSPPTIRLAPSEAELTGRHNHNVQVNMGLNVPPSPVTARGPNSPTFGGSDNGSSDGQPSPRSASFNHYAPVPPQIPVPNGLQVSVQSAENQHRSQAASFNDSSPGYPPSGNLPAIPPRVRGESPVTRGQQMTYEPEPSSPPVLLQPQTYQPYQSYEASPSKPNHYRDESETSVYSNQHGSKHRQSSSTDLSNDFSNHYSIAENSNRNSVALNAPTSLNVPGSSQNANGKPNDARLSEFYDAYYRQSQIIAPSKDSSNRPNQLNLKESTIEEVPTPLASPNPSVPLMQHHAGVAM